MNVKSDGVQVRVGPSVDTSFKANSDGVEVKVLGVGFSADDKHVGFSTPFGEVKFDI